MKKHLKRILATVMAVAIILCAAPLNGFVGLELPDWLSFDWLDFSSMKAYAATEYTSDIYTYTLSGDNATITKVAASAKGDITIPSKLDEHPVVAIGSSAFSDRTAVTSVTLPSGITTIGSYAFSGCTALTSVDLGDATSLGYLLFLNCTSLKSLTIPNTVTSVSRNSSNYETLYGTNEYYPYMGALAGSYVTSVTFEEGIKNIPAYICSWCKTLVNVTIPDREVVTDPYMGITDSYEIGSYAFYQCGAIRSITLPANLTKIGDYAFSGCIGLTSIEVKGKVTSIGNSAFAGCTKLTTATLPKTGYSLGSYAFSGCTALTSVDLGDATSLGYLLFLNCTSLKSLTIPNTVTSVSRNSSNYETLYGTNEYYPYMGALAGSYITDVIFEEDIKNIPAYICSWDKVLVNVTFPDSVTSIGNYAFYNCGKLGTVILPASLTTLSSTAFSEANVEMMHINAEDSQVALTLIDNEIPFTAAETGINDSDDRYLDRNKTYYSSVSSTVSSSGLVTLVVKYDFKETAKQSISNAQLKIRIPSFAPLTANTVRIDGVKSQYTYSNNIVTVPLNKTSGMVTFCVKPNSSEYLMSYAFIDYKYGGSNRTETVGIFNMESTILTIDIPEETSLNVVTVKGVTLPGKTVTVYIDGKNAGTCVASKIGNYAKNITLNNPSDGRVYQIKVCITQDDGIERSVSDSVTYNIETVKMTSCKMYYNGVEYNMMDLSGKQPVITYSGSAITFVVTFENSSIIQDLYIVSKKNGRVDNQIKAVYDKEKKAFVATGFKGYLPGTLSVEYKANNKEFLFNSEFAFNIESAYQSLPREYKNAEVEIIENTYTDENTSGHVHSIITLDDENKSVIDYSASTEIISDSSISEKALADDGFSKIKKTDGSYSYVKTTTVERPKNKNTTQVTATTTSYDFDINGHPTRKVYINTVKDEIIDFIHEDFVIGDTLGNIKNYYDIGKDIYDIYDTKKTVSEMREEINKLNISDKEKEARIAKLNDIANVSYAANLCSVCVTAFGMMAASGFATFGLGWAVGIGLGVALLANLTMNFYDNWIDELFNSYLNDLLNVSFRFAVDPSGFVYEAVVNNRISGVKTTAYYRLNESDEAILWNAAEYDQQNPLYTDNEGRYAWDVPEGLWQVKFEKAGYETTYSEWMPVPPPQLDVNIGIVSTAAPTVEFINIYQDEGEIKFSQYMDIDSITSSNVTFTCGGKTVTGSFEAVDAEKNYDGSKEYATTFSFLPDSNFSGNVTVNINGVKNYADKAIASAYNETKTVVLRVQRLDVPETMSLNYKENGTITLQAAPAVAAAGKKVSITASNSYVAELSVSEVTLDSTGKATVNVKTLLPGDVDITYSIEGTTIKETTILSVVLVPVVEAENITLNVSSKELEVGKTTTLKATITPENATDKSITWSSDKDSVATVDNNGKVTAIAAGTAVITASTTNGELTATCTITVKAAPVETYTVSYDANGGTGAPASQTKTKGVALKLTSDVPTRTNYNFTGWNTKADGSGTAYASGANYTVDAAVTLYAQWQKVEVTLQSISVKTNPTKTTYFVGETLDTAGLVLTAAYSDGSSKDITSGFTCSPTKLTTAGRQTITVTYQGKTTTFVVTVNAPTQGKVKSVSVDNVTLNYKASTTIKPKVDADEEITYTVTYESSNPKVASVDENGNVKALKKGNATITVTVTDQYGNVVKDTCNVTVKYTFFQWIIMILLFGWIWY